MGSAETGYQLGADAAELERVDLRGRVLAPATRTILETAGLRRGVAGQVPMGAQNATGRSSAE
jgi:hypothetical protein